jgi:hypothetical protein
VQQAWVRARRELTRLEPMSTHRVAEERFSRCYTEQDKRKQTLFFPEPCWSKSNPRRSGKIARSLGSCSVLGASPWTS